MTSQSPEEIKSELEKFAQEACNIQQRIQDLLNAQEISGQEILQQIKIMAEEITRALLKIDALDVSRERASKALKDGNKKLSLDISVLVTKRKKCIKTYTGLGDQVDALKEEYSGMVRLRD